MKYSRRPWFFSSGAATSTTVFYTFQNERSALDPDSKIVEVPVQSPPAEESVPVAAQHASKPHSAEAAATAATKIQSTYRSHLVRILVEKVAAVNSEANYWQKIIQLQDTVDAVRSSKRERTKVNEALMSLLLRLDSVPGIDPNVRELRRHVNRRIVGLQEILDAVSDARVENWDRYLNDWDDSLVWIEEEICKEVGGGNEMERFCAEHLGLRCLQKFLSDQ